MKVSISDIKLEIAPSDKKQQKSLFTHGQVQPVILAKNGDGRYTIIDGRRRLVDLVQGGATEVEAIVREATDEQIHLFALIANGGKPNLADEARHFNVLRERYGWTDRQISEATGYSQSRINAIRNLVKLTPALFEELNKGNLKQGAATQLSKLSRKEQKLFEGKKKISEGEVMAYRRAKKQQQLQGLFQESTVQDLPLVISPEDLEYLVKERKMITKVHNGKTLKIRIEDADDVLHLL